MPSHDNLQGQEEGGYSPLPNTPQITRILRNDPIYTRIVDDSFFSGPTGGAERDDTISDDIISIVSSELEADEDVVREGEETSKPGTQSINIVTGNQISNEVKPSTQGSEESQNISQGSHPKWDDVARKACEKKKKAKKEDEDRLRKEDEKIKKKAGKTWFSKNRKEAKDIPDESNFVKRKEIEELAETTISSTNTLASTVQTISSTNTLASTNKTISSETSSSTQQTDCSETSIPPSSTRKRNLQRQQTLLNKDRPTVAADEKRGGDDVNTSTVASDDKGGGDDDITSATHNQSKDMPVFSFEVKKEVSHYELGTDQQFPPQPGQDCGIPQNTEDISVVTTSSSSDYATAVTFVTDSGSSRSAAAPCVWVQSALTIPEDEDSDADIGIILNSSHLFIETHFTAAL